MKNLKTIYIISALIAFIILGFVISTPEFIPSFKFFQLILILAIYLLIIGLAYLVILQLREYLFQQYKHKKASLLTWVSSFLIITFLFVIFIYTSINLRQGSYNRTFVRELNFSAQKVKLYIYDYSFREHITSIKVKDRVLPIMHDVSFFENLRPVELDLWRCKDTVVFIGKNMELIFDLKNRRATKLYKQKSE